MTARSALLLCIAATALASSPRAYAQSRGSSGAATDGWGPDPADTETLDDAPKKTAAPAAPAPAAEKAEPEAADVDEPPAPQDQGPFHVGLDLVLGSGDFGGAAAAGSFSVTSFLFGAGYRDDATAFGIRLPYSSATIEPAGVPSSSHGAFGNLELAASHVLSFSEKYKVPLALALVLPVAAGDPFGNDSAVQIATVQRSASWSRAGEQDPLFLAKHASIVPRLALELDKGMLAIEAHQAVEIVLRAGALKPPEPVDSNMLGLASLTGVSGFAKLLRRRVSLGLRAWLHYDLRSSYELNPPLEKPARSQLAVEPQAQGRLGPATLTLGYLMPVGGDLGDAGVHGIRIGAEASF